MKIVKLKAGYRITCNDGEFEALYVMVEAGQPLMAPKACHSGLSNSGKRYIRKPPFTGEKGPVLAITDNRRDVGTD